MFRYNLTILGFKMYIDIPVLLFSYTRSLFLHCKVTSNTSETSIGASFHQTLTSGTDYTCAYDFGDGGTDVTDEMTTPITGGIVSHTYTTAGTYTVTVNCSNDVSWDSLSFNHKVQDRITGLTLDPPRGATREDLELTYSLSGGSDPQFEFLFGGSTYNVSYDPIAGEATVIIPATDIPASGVYEVYMRAYNDISEEIHAENLTIRTRIIGPQCPPDRAQIIDPTNGVVNFTLSVAAGSGVVVRSNYGVGGPDVDELTQADTEEWGGELIVNFNYSQVGTYHARFNFSNGLGSVVCDQIIIVIVGVAGLQLRSNGPAAFLNGRAPVDFYFESLLDAPPTNAWVDIDYDDGTGTETLPFNMTDADGNRRNYPHVYYAPGVYQVTANVSNNQTSQLLTINITVDIPVVNLDLGFRPLPHAAVGHAIWAVITMEIGKNVDLSVNFDAEGGGSTTKSKHIRGKWSNESQEKPVGVKRNSPNAGT